MELGDPLHVRMSKWGERPHWQFQGVWLGSDDIGEWVGATAGTHHHRPGLEFHSDVDTVTLFPASAGGPRPSTPPASGARRTST